VVTIRYLVKARQRRHMQSKLVRRILSELDKTEHAGRIMSYHPRRLLQMIDKQGHPIGEQPPTG